MFKKSKKLAAAILAAVLALSSVSAAFAADSPADNVPKEREQKVNSKSQDTTVVLVREGKGVTAARVADERKVTVGGNVEVPKVDGGTTRLPVDTLGTKALNGNKKTTKLITTPTVTKYEKDALAGSRVSSVLSEVSKGGTLVLQSESLADNNSLKYFEARGEKKTGDGSVEFGYKTFNNTKVSTVSVTCGKVTFERGAFCGIKKGTKTNIDLLGLREASEFKVKKGAFDSNSKTMTARFSKHITQKEFKRVYKILRDGGFTGKIVRNVQSRHSK